MKDWKAELIAIKGKSSPDHAQEHPKENASKAIKKSVPVTAETIRPLEIERRILQLIQNIEELTISLNEIAPFPLVKGNSRQIKRYVNEIKLSKSEAIELIYQFKPSLLIGTKVPNTNALLIEMKGELLERDYLYQKMLLVEERVKSEKENKERELFLEKEKQRHEKEAAEKELLLQEEAEQKKILMKEVLNVIKECDIQVCKRCDEGKILVRCGACHGTGRLDSAYKDVISVRISCGNLKPNCQLCFGTGIYSKTQQAMNYQCKKCFSGKIRIPCGICKGIQLIPANKNTNKSEWFLKLMASEPELAVQIKNILTSEPI